MNNFSPYSPPYLYQSLPTKVLRRDTVIARTQISCDEDIPEKTIPNSKQRIDIDRNYYDDESDDVYIVEYVNEEVENPNYASQMKTYNAAKKKHDAALVIWNNAKAKWDKKEAKRVEAEERKQYRLLRAKYGKGSKD